MLSLSKMFSLLALTLFFRSLAVAEVPGTVWVGDSELTLDDKIYCSADPGKQPVYRPISGGLPGFSIHKGGLGWIWPRASGGCADGWLRDYLQLQVRGSDLVDTSGAVVGTISNNQIAARNFKTTDDSLRVRDFTFTMQNENSATVAVKFEHPDKKGVFQYTANLKRYRN